ILRAAGLIRRVDRPMKVLGGGELSTALFVVADAFSASARSKIEAAGGTVSVLETPETRRPALGLDAAPAADAPAADAPAADAATVVTEEPAPVEATRPARAARGKAAPAEAPGPGADEPGSDEPAAPDAGPDAGASPK